MAEFNVYYAKVILLTKILIINYLHVQFSKSGEN